MRRVGIELGIRAPMQAVIRGADIAKKNNLNYYFVPETHPKKYGVDAFKALSLIADQNSKTKIGTGIVSVFSRSTDELYSLANKVYEKSNGNFVLGIGASTPQLAEMHNQKFEKPLTKTLDCIKRIKSQKNITIYLAAVGDKMVEAAGRNADGIIFFMKAAPEMERDVLKLRETLYESSKDFESFETISIRPTYITEKDEEWRTSASRTMANYILGNQFYHEALRRAGFWREVSDIRKHPELGTIEAAKKVSDEMLEELTTHGSPERCADEIYRYAKRAKVKTVIAGLDSSKDGYNSDFFYNVERLASSLRSLL